ncbi:MAG: hypothetical protein AAF824_18455 [Bacteroidota bacterium]
MEENKKQLLEELAEAPMLKELKNQLSKEAEDTYFDTLADRVEEKLSLSDELSEAPMLQHLQTEYKEHNVPPEEYFEAQLTEINDQLEEEELVGPMSVLGKVEKNRTVSVPEGYFNQFPNTLHFADENEKGKILLFQRRPLQWIAGLAAAIILLITGIWGLPYLQPSSGMADLSQDELLAMIELEEYDSDDILEVLGEDAMPFSVELLEENLSPDTEIDQVILDEIDLSELDLGAYIE